MKEYMMIFRHEMSNEAPSAEQMQAIMSQWQQWISGIAANGNFAGTNRLLSVGKSIQANKVISDGPYMEAKEIVGGYLIVKANNIDEAMEMAKSCPNLIYGGSVEVRAVMPIDGDPGSKDFLAPLNA